MAFVYKWLEVYETDDCPENVRVYCEEDGAREEIFEELVNAVLDNLIGLETIEQMGGFPRSIVVIRNKIPSEIRTQSGDLGEIVATEYIEEMTEYIVPVRKLRFKSDRNLAMRGDDLIAIKQHNGRVRLYKAEAKSRNRLSKSVVAEACGALESHEGQPNPSSLAFISIRLRNEGNDDLAKVIEGIQESPVPKSRITHIVFTLSGNDPEKSLSVHSESTTDINRLLIGICVDDHAGLIESVFEAVIG